MKRSVFHTAAILAVVALAVSATGTAPAAAADTADTGGVLRVFSQEPATLLPSDATDETSTLVIRQLYSGLVDYDLDGSPVLDLAESIESIDNQEWFIAIKEGYTFHDGEPVDADAFIGAWQHAANGPNAHLFDRIALLEGDGQFLTVHLTEPFPDFPTLLGHTAFSPLAPVCLADPPFCSEEPNGNGPYLFAGWQHDVELRLERNEDYPDPGQANPDVLQFVILPDADAGCQAFLAGALDVVYPAPRDCLRVIDPPAAVFEETSNRFSYLGLPSYVDELTDIRIRYAISLAIDWEGINDTVFGGLHTPADGLVSPHVEGWRPGICTALGACGHDPEAAQALLEEAGGWPGGVLPLWAPAGFGHEEWLTEVGNQLRNTLGIDSTLEVDLPLPEYLATAAAGGFTGPFFLNFDPADPSMRAYLAPQFHSAGRANFAAYANQEVDAILDEGDATGEVELYQMAEEIILEDLPVLPMWFDAWRALWRDDRVGELVWSLFNGPEYGRITVVS